MNVCFYHMYCIGDCLLRLNATLHKMQTSGLYEHLDAIHVNLVGQQSNKLSKEFPFTDSKIVMHNVSTETSGEMDTMRLLWDECSKLSDDTNVLYLHSKGVSRPTCDNVKAWIEYMEYFIIDRWRDCNYNLHTASTCGVNLQNEPMRHYSGNFWWAKARHIKNRDRFDPQKSSYITTPRSYCEFWLLDTKENTDAACMHSSNIDHYATFYDKHKYKTN